MTSKRFDLRSIRAGIPEIQKRHNEFLKDIDALNDDLLQRLLVVAESAVARPEPETCEGSYLFVFLGLASKVVSHAEAIRTVVSVGRYGDASMLIRGLIGDVIMLQYIAGYPEDCGEICEMSRVRKQGWKSGSRYRELGEKYKESNLRKKIEEVGDRPWSGEIYGIYSEPSHPSVFGLKFYGRQVKGVEAEFVLTWGPQIEQVASFRCASALTALLVDALDTFFVWNQRSGGDSWADGLEKDWMSMREQYFREVQSATNYLITAHKRLYPADE